MSQQKLTAGILAGLIAGVVFGIYMGALGMLPMVGKLIGQESAGAGFILHLVFSAIIGFSFGIVVAACKCSFGVSKLIVYGLIHGLVWWVLGPLVIMPVWLGMGVQLSAAGAKMALPSLWGHSLYGLILGILYPVFAKAK